MRRAFDDFWCPVYTLSGPRDEPARIWLREMGGRTKTEAWSNAVDRLHDQDFPHDRESLGYERARRRQIRRFRAESMRVLRVRIVEEG